MKSCSICKTMNENDYNYCKYCGTKFESYEIEMDSKKLNTFLIVIFIILIVLSLIFYKKIFQISYLVNLVILYSILMIVFLVLKNISINSYNKKVENISLVEKEKIVEKYKPKKYEIKLFNPFKLAVNILITILCIFTFIMLYFGIYNVASTSNKTYKIVNIFNFKIMEVDDAK